MLKKYNERKIQFVHTRVTAATTIQKQSKTSCYEELHKLNFSLIVMFFETKITNHHSIMMYTPWTHLLKSFQFKMQLYAVDYNNTCFLKFDIFATLSNIRSVLFV